MNIETSSQPIKEEQNNTRAKKLKTRFLLGAAGISLAVGTGVGLSEITTGGNPTYRQTTSLEKSILGKTSDLTPDTFFPATSEGVIDLQIPAIDINNRTK